jgi:hypothetical protein
VWCGYRNLRSGEEYFWILYRSIPNLYIRLGYACGWCDLGRCNEDRGDVEAGLSSESRVAAYMSLILATCLYFKFRLFKIKELEPYAQVIERFPKTLSPQLLSSLVRVLQVWWPGFTTSRIPTRHIIVDCLCVHQYIFYAHE